MSAWNTVAVASCTNLRQLNIVLVDLLFHHLLQNLQRQFVRFVKSHVLEKRDEYQTCVACAIGVTSLPCCKLPVAKPARHRFLHRLPWHHIAQRYRTDRCESCSAKRQLDSKVDRLMVGLTEQARVNRYRLSAALHRKAVTGGKEGISPSKLVSSKISKVSSPSSHHHRPHFHRTARPDHKQPGQRFPLRSVRHT